jgi:hypothetical protein
VGGYALFRTHLVLRLVAAFALALAVGLTSPRADCADARGAKANAPERATAAISSNDSSLRGFDALATAGWGASTATIRHLELAPYGASFGVELGYTWPLGLRVGAYFSDSLGHGVTQPRDALIGRDYAFTADSSSIHGGLSVGWAVPLYALVLRYNLSFGVTAMHWDFHDVPARLAHFGDAKNPSVGAHFAPGLALLWPYRWFEGGVGFDYLVQASGTLPSGFVGKVLIGVRL